MGLWFLQAAIEIPLPLDVRSSLLGVENSGPLLPHAAIEIPLPLYVRSSLLGVENSGQ